MKRIKKFLAGFLALLMVLPAVTLQADDFALRDEINNIWVGRVEGPAIIENAQFQDLWGPGRDHEVVARGVALGLVHGNGRLFRPNDLLTHQEALSFVMGALGLSGYAAALGTTLAVEYGITDAQTMLNLGALYMLSGLGLVVVDGFNPNALVTREQVASILFSAITLADPTIFDWNAPIVRVYGFSDWREINALFFIAVEHMVSANIFEGVGDAFLPGSNVTRSEMAHLMANMDSILFEINGWERFRGTVADIRDAQYTTTAEAALWRNIYVRLGDGSIDVLQHQIVSNPSPQITDMDASVFANGLVGGLGMLWYGDTIEFIVHRETGVVLYVNVLHPAFDTAVVGQLFSLSRAESTITLRDAVTGNHFVYSVAEGIFMYLWGREYMLMDTRRHLQSEMPFGQLIRLILRNNVVVELEFVGQPVLVDEIRGLVVENNPAFGYLVIIDNEGRRVVLRYYQNEMLVQKLRHWDNHALGYIVHLFPTFTFDPSVTTISEINPGDIVFIRTDPDDPNVITMISAATNYIMRYGRVAAITHNDGFMTVLFEQENGRTTLLDIADDILITRQGRRFRPNAIQVGDWARALVNEAIIAPGHTITSVVEMTIEGDNRHISNIVRGNLSGINRIQQQMVIEHAQTLGQTGWTNHREVASFDLRGNHIRYFHNNRQISRDEAMHVFGRSDATVYIALENHFAGERVQMVSFRTEREERLPHSTVIHADGLGGFQLTGFNGTITTDAGTIVRRHGRLVSGFDIFPSDHVSVVLNGQNRAAIIDISPAPDTSALQIMRARVTDVADGESFTVASMSQLFGNNWVFTPIQREWTIDPRTVFLGEGGFVDPRTFLAYTETSVVDQVFTIVTDGARASHVIAAPFANRSVRGQIFAIDGNTVSLRNVTIQDPVTNQWNIISNINNTIVVNIPANGLIGRNNAVVQARDLRIGDNLLVLTNYVPALRVPGMNINGMILLVE